MTHRLHKLVRVADGVLPLHELAQPAKGHRLILRGCAAALFVGIMRRKASLSRVIHLRRADLDLDELSLGSDDGRVQALVAVLLGERHEVLEPARYRPPLGVDVTERRVAVAHARYDHSKRHGVVNLGDRDALLL